MKISQPISTWVNLARSRPPWVQNIMGALLMGCGLVFVLNSLRGQMENLPATEIGIRPPEYAALILLATLTTLITASLHAEILAKSSANLEIDRNFARYAYSVSQVARYIPGKVFGVILESQMLGPAIGISKIIKATLLQTLLVYAWASIASISILAAITLHSAWLLLLAPAMIPVMLSNKGSRMLFHASNLIRTNLANQSPQMRQNGNTRQYSYRITLLLTFQWVPFFAMWILITGINQVSDAFWLGASYLLASIAGSLLVFAPSGLILREAVFIWIGGFHGLPAASLLIWAIVMRLVLTLADIVAIPLLWAALRLRRRA